MGIKEDFLKLIKHYDGDVIILPNGRVTSKSVCEKELDADSYTLNEEYYKRVRERLAREKEDTI